MKYKFILTAMFSLSVSVTALAKDISDSDFPYGMLELRGYPMEMKRDGSFRIYSGSTVFAKGNFEVDGNKMTISDHGGQYACRGRGMNPGSYLWEKRDGKLFLTAIKDRCGARRTAFMEAPLETRQESD